MWKGLQTMIFRLKQGIENRVAANVAKSTFNNYAHKKTKKKPRRSMVRDILENTDDYELNAKVVDGEFVIRIKRQDKENENGGQRKD